MPKHSKDSADLFITKALTNQNVNLSSYEDEAFKNSIRLAAINSILSILRDIHIKYTHAQQSQQYQVPFNILKSINQVHASTGLNMLDYCLAAGFYKMAVDLIRHGATSKNLQAFEKNFNNNFPPSEMIQPDIVRDIRTIISGGMEIKDHYDHFVNKTNAVLPRMTSAGKRIYQGYSTPTLIMAGIGGVLLLPLLQPLIHGFGATAIFVSAGFLPAAISGLYSSNRNRHPQSQPHSEVALLEQSQHDLEILKNLICTAEDFKADIEADIKSDLNKKSMHLQQHSKHKKHILRNSLPAPLLFQLSNSAALTPPPQEEMKNKASALKKALA